MIDATASHEINRQPTRLASGKARRRVTFALTREQKAYLGALAIALLMCWSPSNALGYIAPFVSLGWYILYTRSSRALIGMLGYFCCWGLVISLYIVFMPEFALPSAFLAIITYSSFATFLVITPRAIAGPRIYNRVLSILSFVLLIEGTWGIVQAVYGFSQTGTFYGFNGDYVEGTIHPWLAAELAFSNPMFAVNIACILIALVPTVVLLKKKILPFLVGGLAFILASVLHVIYLAGIAACLSVLFVYPSIIRKKISLLLGAFTLIFLLVTANLVGIRVDAALNFMRLNLEGRTPRGVVMEHAFNEIPAEYTLMPLLGIGPGQFSSRAGLIGTGYYFGRPEKPRTVPLLPTSMSPAFRDYVLVPWVYTTRPAGLTGSTTQPYFSWLSVYVEFGGIVFGGVLLLVLYALFRIRQLARSAHLRIHGIALGANILLLFLLGVQENYWEISQAIFIGVLLIQLQWAQLIYLRSQIPLTHPDQRAGA